MKRFYLLAIILLFLGIILAQLFLRHIPESDPLELVDANSGLLIDMPDAAAIGVKLLHSRFGRNFTSIDWSYVLEQLEVTGNRRRPLQEDIGALLDMISSPLWKKVFGKRIVVALFPPEQQAQTTFLSAQDLLVSQMVFIASPRVSSLLEQLISSLVWLKGEVHRVSYRGRTIYSLQGNQGTNLYYAVVDGHIVASAGQRTVERCVDLSLRHVVQEHTGLVTKSEYQDLRKRYKGDDVFVYADVGRLVTWLAEGLFRNNLESILGTLPHKTALRRVAFFHADKGHKQRLIAISQWDKELLSSVGKQVVMARPDINKMLPEIPSELVMYFWSNWLDLSGWWQAVKSPSDATGQSEFSLTAARWIQENTGLDMDEFVGLFGSEVGLNITGIRTSGFFPVPSVCCFFEVTDPERVDTILKKSLAGLPLRRDTIAGMQVVSVMIAGGLMQPSYALRDNILMIADSREQIIGLLSPQSQRLVSDSLFKAVDTGMTTPSNLHVFARTSEIIESLKELATWGGTVIAVRDGASGRKWKVVIDQIVLPLLDGLKTFQAKGVRAYAVPGEVIVDAVVQTAVVEQRSNKQ